MAVKALWSRRKVPSQLWCTWRKAERRETDSTQLQVIIDKLNFMWGYNIVTALNYTICGVNVCVPLHVLMFDWRMPSVKWLPRLAGSNPLVSVVLRLNVVCTHTRTHALNVTDFLEMLTIKVLEDVVYREGHLRRQMTDKRWRDKDTQQWNHCMEIKYDKMKNTLIRGNADNFCFCVGGLHRYTGAVCGENINILFF